MCVLLGVLQTEYYVVQLLDGGFTKPMCAQDDPVPTESDRQVEHVRCGSEAGLVARRVSFGLAGKALACSPCSRSSICARKGKGRTGDSGPR
jgi:hypothetical protein